MFNIRGYLWVSRLNKLAREQAASVDTHRPDLDAVTGRWLGNRSLQPVMAERPRLSEDVAHREAILAQAEAFNRLGLVGRRHSMF